MNALIWPLRRSIARISWHIFHNPRTLFPGNRACGRGGGSSKQLGGPGQLDESMTYGNIWKLGETGHPRFSDCSILHVSQYITIYPKLLSYDSCLISTYIFIETLWLAPLILRQIHQYHSISPLLLVHVMYPFLIADPTIFTFVGSRNSR